MITNLKNVHDPENNCKIMKVLVIDDNVAVTDMLEGFLKLEGFDVSVSNDGKHGLNLIQNENFDKILLDLSMPGFSGMDVLNALQNRFDMKKIHLFTAFSFSNAEENDFLKLGIRSILPKPVDLFELLYALKN